MAARAFFRLRIPGADNGMYRGMAQLALGGILARAISIFTVPVVSRIYSPADFGLLSVYMSVIQIVLPLLSFRYVFAIPLPRNDATALNLFALCALSSVALLLPVALGLFLFARPFFGLFSADKLAPWWVVVVLGLLIAGASELLGSWATRKRAYRKMAVNSVTALMFGETLKILLGLIGVRPLGLIIGQITGQSGGLLTYTRAFFDDFRKIPRVVSWKKMAFLARYYSSFPTFRLVSQFLLAFAIQAPLLYTARLYGVAVSGQLGLALMTLALPLNLIGQAIGKAYYAEMAKIGRSRPDQILAVSKKVQLRLFIAGLPPTVFLMFFGEPLFAFVFGKAWHLAGKYAAILSLYTLFQFTSQPMIQILNIFSKQVVFLAMNAFRLALVLGLFWACGRFSLSATVYVQLYAQIMAAFYVLITVYIFYVLARLRSARKSLTDRSGT